MIPSTGINNAREFAPGWLATYLDAVSGNKFPDSYHLLAGMFVLGTAVGRRASVRRGPIQLWPPQSVILLGPSAIGKSQSLYLAGRVLEAFALDPWENEAGQFEYRKGFSLTEQGFTPRGLMEEWYRIQSQQQAEVLEGAHIETEMSKVVQPNKKGSEGVSTWIISALEHRDLRDLTGMYGKRTIKHITVAFAFASTMQYLRKVLDADEFAGGLMHRFLISHERAGKQVTEPKRPDEREIQKLAQALIEIRTHAPGELELPPKIRTYIDRLDKQQKWFKNHQLAGFWGRFADLTMKVSQLYALATKATALSMEHVEMAETLLRHRLAPVLSAIVEELDASPDYKKLLDLADSLETTGPEGWTRREFFRRCGLTDQAKQGALFDSIVTMGLAWAGAGRVYGRQEWVPTSEEPGAAPDE